MSMKSSVTNLKNAVIVAAIIAIFAAVSVSGVSFASIGDTLQTLGQGGTSSDGNPQGGIVANCFALNVRSGPGTEHPVIGGLRAGAAISIIGNENGWWKIKYNGGVGYVSGKYIDTKPSQDSSETAVNFKGHVEVDTSLNIRNSPWGEIVGRFGDGEDVEVVGKVGSWYKIKHNGKIAYAYASYIKKGAADRRPTPSNNGDDRPVATGPAGDMQKRIVAAAERYIGSTRFRGREVDYGNKACAQFVSTALKDAGVVSRVQLGVLGVIPDLKNRGWKEVSAPPFKAGDVVTWKTYDRTGDGVKDNDTHIGIMGDDGQAISNSSSLKMPRKHSVYYAPICRVLRHS